MAIVYCDTGFINSNFVWPDHYEIMGIKELFISVFALLAPVEEADAMKKVYDGLIITGKVLEKNEEGTWDESVHEELNMMTKDFIYRIGDVK